MDPVASPARRRASRDTALMAAGVAAWVAIGVGGSWLWHQFTRPTADCGAALEGRATPDKAKAAAGGPRNALQLLSGTGRCQ